VLDGDRVIRCQITPHSARCVLGRPFGLDLPPGISDDEDDPDVEGYLRWFDGLSFDAGNVASQVTEPGENAMGSV
jgi:hypothetical protein